jgi:molecular chaperone GrpE
MAEDIKKEQEQEQNKNKDKDTATADKTQDKKKTSGRKKSSRKEGKKEINKEKEKIRELEDSLKEANDKFLRLYSEFDNFRKRTLKEKVELSKTASEDVIYSLLPVIDDLERALKSMEEKENAEKEGIILIYNKLKNILEQKGLKSIDAMGQDFDVDYHEAVTNIPVPSDDQKGKVVDVIERGYLLGDKVIRYSKVVVGQ